MVLEQLVVKHFDPHNGGEGGAEPWPHPPQLRSKTPQNEWFNTSKPQTLKLCLCSPSPPVPNGHVWLGPPPPV